MRLHREHSCDDGLSWSSLLSAAPWRSSLTVGQPVIPRKFFVVDRLDMIDREGSGSHVSPSQRGFVPLIRGRLELDLGTLLTRAVAVIPRGRFRPCCFAPRCFYYIGERVPCDKCSLICNRIIECFTLLIFFSFLLPFFQQWMKFHDVNPLYIENSLKYYILCKNVAMKQIWLGPDINYRTVSGFLYINVALTIVKNVYS